MHIVCWKCGTPILPSEYNLCTACVSTEIDITSSLLTSRFVEHCRQCDRYLSPPKKWITCGWHSRELLAFLLHENTQLSKFKILDSVFVYTEEHSKQIEHSVVLERDGIKKQINIKYRIRNKQCPNCQNIEAKLYWSSVVQVRQRVPHKKTLLFLEQLILHAKAFNDTSNIKERKDGIDFYYQNKVYALKMVEFIKKTIMVRLKVSEQLITEDKKSNKSKYKFTYSLEIVPICRDDIIRVSDKIARKYGIGRINIVLKVNSNIKLIDPASLKITEIDSRNYWGYQEEFQVLMSSRSLKKFTISEIEKTGIENGKYSQSDVFISTGNNEVRHCKSHMGNLLREGGSVLGYDFEHSPLADEVIGEFQYYLVKKEKIKRKRTKTLRKRKIRGFEENLGNKNEKMIGEFENMGI